MRHHRPERVGGLIREKLSNLIAREVEFRPGILVTLTDVRVDKGLGRAKVGVSVLPSAGEKEAMEILESCAGKLQHLLFKKINIKPMPKVSFELDHGLERAAIVEKCLLEEEK